MSKNAKRNSRKQSTSARYRIRISSLFPPRKSQPNVPAWDQRRNNDPAPGPCPCLFFFDDAIARTCTQMAGEGRSASITVCLIADFRSSRSRCDEDDENRTCWDGGGSLGTWLVQSSVPFENVPLFDRRSPWPRRAHPASLSSRTDGDSWTSTISAFASVYASARHRRSKLKRDSKWKWRE